MFRFFSSTNSVNQIRSYLKGTDVLAQMGGLMKIFMSVGELVFYLLYHQKMNENIITKLFHITEKDIRENSRKNDDINDMKIIPFCIASKLDQRNKNLDFNVSNINLKTSKNSNLSALKLNEISCQMKDLNKNNNVNSKVQKMQLFKKDSSENKNKFIDQILSKKNPNSKDRLKEIMNSSEFFLSKILCKFCLPKNIKIKKVNHDYLCEITSEFTDIMKIVKNMQEIKKIKYIIFSKKQLAILNLLEDPEYPYEYKKYSKLNEKLKLEKNQTEITKKAIQFLKQDEYSIFDDKFNKRLLKFLDIDSVI